MATRRLTGMVARFRRDPARKKKIFEAVKKLEDSGYVDKDFDEGDVEEGCPIWYLPIHVVEKNIKGRGLQTHVSRRARLRQWRLS